MQTVLMCQLQHTFLEINVSIVIMLVRHVLDQLTASASLVKSSNINLFVMLAVNSHQFLLIGLEVNANSVLVSV
jgi:hypothetical protein